MSSSYICFYLKEGTITNITGLEQVRRDSMMVCLNDIKKGYISMPLQHKGQRLGPIILQAENRDIMEEKIKKIQNTLVIETDSSNYRNAILWN